MSNYFEKPDEHLKYEVFESNSINYDKYFKKICMNCSNFYTDGFCMLLGYYPSKNHTCDNFTTEPLKFSYKKVYEICKFYIELYEKYVENEEIEHSSGKFFTNCCLNDLKREMSNWRFRK